MTDGKSLHGQADRARVSAEEPSQVQHFAEDHGISVEDARRVIKNHGPNRAKADAAAEQLKSAG